MGLEIGTYVQDLVATNPITTDKKNAGDDHFRLVKTVLKNTFPNSTKASYFSTFSAKTTDYTVLAADENKTITVDATAGLTTLVLPTLAAGDDGWTVRIIKIDASTNAVALTGTVNGRTDYSLNSRYNSATLFWSGTAWYSLDDDDVQLLSTLTDPAVGDFVRLHDISANDEVKITLQNFFKIIDALTADASPEPSTDYLVTYDASASLPKKILLQSVPIILPRGYIDGLILSNGTDATNDINIAEGTCRDSTNAVNIDIATAIGKQLDANWAAGGTTGTPVGGKNSGAGIANGTYHVWAVRTATSSAGDIYLHTSTTPATVLAALQAETGGASYAYLRRIGSILRASASIVAFTQSGDKFTRTSIAQDVAANDPGTSAVTRTLSVPTGLVLEAIVTVGLSNTATGFGDLASALLTSLTSTDQAPVSASLSQTGTANSQALHARDQVSGLMEIRTNTSAQIRSRVGGFSSAAVNIYINTYGWIDLRGRDA